MVNIGEISKPGVGVSPVKPQRSTSDSEITVAADNVGTTVKVSTQIYPKNRKKTKKDPKDNDQENKNAEQPETQSQINKHDESKSDQASEEQTSCDDVSYDENGHLSHHGKIDIKA